MTAAADPTRDDIAVIGMACRFPRAKDLDALWGLLLEGGVTFEDIPASRWNHATFLDRLDVRAPDKTYVQRGAFVEGVDEFAALHYGLAPRRVQVMDPQQRLVIELTRQALQDAGYEAKPLDREGTGLFIGASVSEYKDLMGARHRALQMADGSWGDRPTAAEAEALRAAVADIAPVRAFSIAGSLLNMIPCSVAQVFDLHGPAMQIDAACSSALVAIHEAVVNLRAGQCNVAIAGGVYLNLTPDNLIGFSRIGAISPSGVCRPFDAKADGFVMGEGAGLVVLKRAADARRDGDRVYAVVRGTGCNNDGRGDGPMTPRPEGQRDAMRRAHAGVDFPLDTIGYVETHGTATTVGDVVEVGALRDFFAERGAPRQAAAPCHLGSIKANIGHTMSAAGVAGFIKACLMLRHRTIPPQPSVDELNPKLELEASPFRIAREATPWEPRQDSPRRAAVSSFGFGGTNAHVLLEEAPAPATVAPADDRPELFALSAPTPRLLADYARQLADVVERRALATPDVAFTLARRASFPARLVLVARHRDELVTQLRACAAALATHGDEPGQTVGELPRGARFAFVPAETATATASARKLAFLFPGQGSQRVGLLRDLVARFPGLRAHLERLDAALGPIDGISLLQALYPPPSMDLAAAQTALTRTELCQPVMVAVGVAIDRWLRDLHLTPDVVLGHSLGEFAAAVAAGVLDDTDAVSLVALRGRLMRALPLEDPGTMAAVQAPPERVAQALAGLPAVVVANHNHPSQTVISGPGPAVASACQRLDAAGLRTTPLDVSHAFHSPLMGGIEGEFRGAIEALSGRAPRLTLVSCITGRAVDSFDEARAIWARHATSPVQFVAALRTCAEHGVTHFLQLGAGGALLSFARGTVPTEGRSFASLEPADGGDRGAQALDALGRLWLDGYPVALDALAERGALETLPPSPVEQQRYWVVERVARAPRVTRDEKAAQPPLPRRSAPPAGPKKAPMDNLIALFQQQNALLQSQADILRAQASALQAAVAGGAAAEVSVELQQALGQAVAQVAVPSLQASPGGQAAGAMVVQPMVMQMPVPQLKAGANATVVPPARPSVTARPAAPPAPAAKGPPPAPGGEPSHAEVQAKVLGSIARISAFPAASLRLQQTLVGELGFDSLMLVELDQDVAKAFPRLGGLPRELFSKSTSIADIVEHVTKALAAGADAATASEAQADDATAALPLERFVPVVVPAPRAALREGAPTIAGPVLVTPGVPGLAEALVDALAARGVAAVVGSPSTVGDFKGVVHLGDMRTRGGFGAPAAHGLALAKRLSPESASCFVAVTDLGGTLGLRDLDGDALGQIGLLGFTKALAQEWPRAIVKAIDVEPTLAPAMLAASIAEELLSGDRCGEVGFTARGRVAVALRAQPATADERLGGDSVVLVTGGAKGIGLKLAKAIAARHRCVVALAGRSAPSAEAAKACAQIKAAGARTCTYHAMDVREPASVRAAVAAVRDAHGRVDAVVHAAGVLADALVGNKSVEQLEGVLQTKVGGALHLLEAAGSELKLAAFVGSWSGRFGNAAQTDYSAANAMLARLPQLTPSTVRSVTVAFPPWADSDMARRIPAFRKAELRAEGVVFLGDEQGTSAFMAELAGGAGESLVGRSLPERRVRHAGRIPLSLETHPFLADHTMAGQRVLPLASALELAAASALDVLPGAAGAEAFVPFAVSDFRLVRGVLVNEPTALDVELGQEVRSGAQAACTVLLKQGAAVAYRGVVSTSPEAPTLPKAEVAPTSALPLSLVDFYAHHTFHGPRLRGIARVEGVSEAGVVGWVRSCRPSDWVARPARDAWSVDPLLVDSSFQLAGYWAWVKHQRAGFPTGFARFVQLRPFGDEPVRCTATFEAVQGDVFRGTLRWENAAGELLAVMLGAEAEFVQRDPQFGARASGAPHEAAAATATHAESAPLGAPTPGATAASDDEAARPTLELDESMWNPARFPEYEELQERLQMAEAFGLRNPYFSVHDSICGDTTVVGGREMLNFSSYNYVGNSGDPVVTRAVQEAVERYGTSVSASRVASGEKPLTLELERELARFFGTEDCVVLVSGHATNVTVIGHVAQAPDLILHDALAHDSIIQGAKLSGAKRRPFPHNDWKALDAMLTRLRRQYRRVLICIEGTYSMDGDIPDLPKFIEVKKKHHAMLLVDEAHSAGVVGDTGRGVGEYFGVDRADVDMWMGTLSKSFASCGGYICGSKALVEYLKYTTPGFVYSVGISPANAAAALAATRQLVAHPERVQRARENARYFIELLKARGIDTGFSKDTAVVPAIIGNSVLCLQLSDALKDRGINVQPILYPAVEDDQARLRFFLSSLHKREQLEHTADVLKAELDRLTREMNATT